MRPPPEPPTEPPQSTASRAAEAERLAHEIASLARQATRQRFTMLAYLLDMALVEAWTAAGDPDGIKPPVSGGSGPAPRLAQ